jgi:hypothetical protein
MARYEDTATPFAEQQFAGVRERKQKEAEKQDKFAKRLLMFNTVAKGANDIINKRADQLEANQTAKKTAYTKVVQNAESLLQQETMLRQANMTASEYYTNLYYNQLVQDAETTYANYNLGATTNKAGTTAHNFLREQAKKYGSEKAKTYEEALKEARDVGTLEDLDKRWDSLQQIQAPRTIFGSLTNVAKNVFEKETPETVAYKEGIAKDALFNQPILKEYEEFGSQLKIYDSKGFDIGNIISTLGKDFDMIVKTRGVPIVQANSKVVWRNGKKYNQDSLDVITLNENDQINVISNNLRETEVAPEELLTADLMSFMETVPVRHKDTFSALFERSSYPTSQDLIDAYTLQATKPEFHKSPVKDVKDGLEMVGELQSKLLHSRGYLTQKQMDKYGITGYEKGEQMFTKHPDTDLVTIRPEFLDVIIGEGWDFPTLVDRVFNEADISTLTNKMSNAVFMTSIIEKHNIYTQSLQLLNGTAALDSDVTKQLLGTAPTINQPNPVYTAFVKALNDPKQQGVVVLPNLTDLSNLFDDTISGTGVIYADLNNNTIHYKQDEPEEQLTASTVDVNTGGAVLSNVDAFTIDFQGKKILDSKKVATLVSDLDLTDLSTDELMYLYNLSLHDIKDKIGLEDISKGGIFTNSNGQKSYYPRMNNIGARFSRFDAVQDELSKRNIAIGSGNYSIAKELPDEFYAQLTEIFQDKTLLASI